VVTFGPFSFIFSPIQQFHILGYRMNVFGLLNLNYLFHELNPPNTVLHGSLALFICRLIYLLTDILAAIRWSRKEIVNFGGDPNRVFYYYLCHFFHYFKASLWVGKVPAQLQPKLFVRISQNFTFSHYFSH
jgi:hypothetical protein